MEAEFWRARWREGRIGFHEGRPNAHLVKHLAQLGSASRVLVPLCGKAEDLAWLAAQGREVVGVELVEDAVRAFFAEHGLSPRVEPAGALVRWTAGPITLLAGDVFAAGPSELGRIDALYDRAATIALPPELRRRYVAHLRALLPSGAPGLVVTVEYPPEAGDGPPFSVPEAELRALYAGLPVERLDEVRASGGRFDTLAAREKVFAVRF